MAPKKSSALQKGKGKAKELFSRVTRGSSRTNVAPPSPPSPPSPPRPTVPGPSMTKKDIINGKCLVDVDLKGTNIVPLILFQGWESYMHISEPVYYWQVKEFYANIMSDPDNIYLLSTVGGVVIRFDTAELGQILEIPATGKYLWSNKQWPEISMDDVRNICRFMWNNSEDCDEELLPPRNRLTVELRILLNLLMENVAPRVCNDGRCNFMEACIIYFLNQFEAISLPYLIIMHMLHIKKNNNTLGYGMVLTKFFKHFGVPLDEKEASPFVATMLFDMVSINRQGFFWYNNGWIGKDEFMSLPEAIRKEIRQKAKTMTTYVLDDEFGDLGEDRDNNEGLAMDLDDGGDDDDGNDHDGGGSDRFDDMGMGGGFTGASSSGAQADYQGPPPQQSYQAPDVGYTQQILSAIGSGFESMTARFENFETRIESRMDRVEQRLDGYDSEFRMIHQRRDAFESQMGSRLDGMSTQLNDYQRQVSDYQRQVNDYQLHNAARFDEMDAHYYHAKNSFNEFASQSHTSTEQLCDGFRNLVSVIYDNHQEQQQFQRQYTQHPHMPPHPQFPSHHQYQPPHSHQYQPPNESGSHGPPQPSRNYPSYQSPTGSTTAPHLRSNKKRK